MGGRSEKDTHQYRGGRSSYDPSKVGVKTSLPIEVLTKKEEGIDGDFRKKLRKAEATKIDTTKAFPQAKPKGSKSISEMFCETSVAVSRDDPHQ